MRVLLLIFISSLYSSTDVSFYQNQRDFFSISCWCPTSYFFSVTTCICWDWSRFDRSFCIYWSRIDSCSRYHFHPSNFYFIEFQQPLEPSSFRLHCKIIEWSNRIIFEIVLMNFDSSIINYCRSIVFESFKTTASCRVDCSDIINTNLWFQR